MRKKSTRKEKRERERESERKANPPFFPREKRQVF
jgi:hypothetical protein